MTLIWLSEKHLHFGQAVYTRTVFNGFFMGWNCCPNGELNNSGRFYLVDFGISACRRLFVADVGTSGV